MSEIEQLSLFSCEEGREFEISNVSPLDIPGPIDIPYKSGDLIWGKTVRGEIASGALLFESASGLLVVENRDGAKAALVPETCRYTSELISDGLRSFLEAKAAYYLRLMTRLAVLRRPYSKQEIARLNEMRSECLRRLGEL